MKSIVTCLLVAALFSACAPAESPKPAVAPAPDAAAIAKEAHESYVAAINSNDVETLMRAVTNDIVYMPPHDLALAGKDAVRGWVHAYFGAYRTQREKTTLEFVVAGDWAFEQYSYKSTDTPVKGGAAATDTGKGINIYRREADGKWRVARDVWNSDLPAPKN
jgi:ketosteroid isomerase-like protein